MAPPDPEIYAESESSSNAHSLKAAIFHTMAFEMSLEINTNKLILPTNPAFLNHILFSVCTIKKKNITIEQFARLHYDDTEIAICETESDTVFVLHSAFTSKDNYFQVAIQEATDAFNKIMTNFSYHQNLELYDPHIHQVPTPQNHPFYCFAKQTFIWPLLFIALLPNLHHL